LILSAWLGSVLARLSYFSSTTVHSSITWPKTTLHQLHYFSSTTSQTSYLTENCLGSCFYRYIYTDCVSFWIGSQRSPPMKLECDGVGQIVFLNMRHHNINGGPVDNTWRHR
jgi:hypothetical protein